MYVKTLNTIYILLYTRARNYKNIKSGYACLLVNLSCTYEGQKSERMKKGIKKIVKSLVE